MKGSKAGIGVVRLLDIIGVLMVVVADQMMGAVVVEIGASREVLLGGASRVGSETGAEMTGSPTSCGGGGRPNALRRPSARVSWQTRG